MRVLDVLIVSCALLGFSTAEAGHRSKRSQQVPAAPARVVKVEPTIVDFVPSYGQVSLQLSSETCLEGGYVAFNTVDILSNNMVYDENTHLFSIKESGVYAIDFYIKAKSDNEDFEVVRADFMIDGKTQVTVPVTGEKQRHLIRDMQVGSTLGLALTGAAVCLPEEVEEVVAYVALHKIS